MKQMLLLLSLLFAPVVFSQTAVIYKSVDKQGRVTFSDHPQKQAYRQEKLTVQIKSEAREAQSLNKKQQQQIRKLQHTNNKRKRLQQQLLLAKAKLQRAQLVLNSAQKRRAKAYADCERKKKQLEKNKDRSRFYVCQHTSVALLQLKVKEARKTISITKDALHALDKKV